MRFPLLGFVSGERSDTIIDRQKDTATQRHPHYSNWDTCEWGKLPGGIRRDPVHRMLCRGRQLLFTETAIAIQIVADQVTVELHIVGQYRTKKHRIARYRCNHDHNTPMNPAAEQQVKYVKQQRPSEEE